VALEQDADGFARLQQRAPRARQRRAEHLDRTGRGLQFARQRRQQGGLAAARRTQHRGDAAARHREVDAVEDRAAAALQAQAGQADDGGGVAHAAIVAFPASIAIPAGATALRHHSCMPTAHDFRLYHSNALDVLAGLLAEELRAPAPGQPLLAPDTILVPQVAMRRWLQATLAERHGIAANLEFLTPGEFVARALQANPGAPAGPEL